jgi:hypothetical protein
MNIMPGNANAEVNFKQKRAWNIDGMSSFERYIVDEAERKSVDYEVGL